MALRHMCGRERGQPAFESLFPIYNIFAKHIIRVHAAAIIKAQSTNAMNQNYNNINNKPTPFFTLRWRLL